MPSEIIIIVIELMFLGVNMFLALLRTQFSPRLRLGPKTYLRPRTSTLLLYFIKAMLYFCCYTTLSSYFNFLLHEGFLRDASSLNSSSRQSDGKTERNNFIVYSVIQKLGVKEVYFLQILLPISTFLWLKNEIMMLALRHIKSFCSSNSSLQN